MSSFWIHDLTTTPDAPPVFRALEREGRNVNRNMKYPDGLAEAQKRAFPDLAPLRASVPAERLFELAQSTALEMRGWEIVSVESARYSLEAVAGAGWFRVFKDDIVIQVRADGEGDSSLHMRCKPRLALWRPRGNAARIRKFLSRISQKLG